MGIIYPISKDCGRFKVVEELTRDPCDYRQKITRYYVCNSNSTKFAYCEGILFYDKKTALEVCKYMNDAFENAVDETINDMFKNGELKIPFDFLKEWENENKDAIKSKFSEDSITIVCDFANDLLIIYDNNSGYFTKETLANRLCVDVIWSFSSLTMHYRVTIINVAKIKEYYNKGE